MEHITDKIELAPVFDCGSCMYPQASDEIMESVLNNRQELNQRIFNMPTSAIKENDSRINYFDFISSLKNRDCNNALNRLHNRINLTHIHAIIDEIPFATNLQKHFYKTMISERKAHIIDYSFRALCQKEL